MHISQSPNIPLSALGGGEARGEVGGAAGPDRRYDPPHPPTPFGVGPSLSPRKQAERGQKRRETHCARNVWMSSIEEKLFAPIQPLGCGELLLELLSEEVPAGMQRRAIAELTELLRAKLTAA